MHLPGVALDGSLMRAWLALAAAKGPDDPGPLAAALPAIGYGWWPDLPGGAAAAEALVRLAAEAGILICPAGVTPALQHYGGTYRVLVTVRGPGGAVPLTIRRAGQSGGGSPRLCPALIARYAVDEGQVALPAVAILASGTG